jgi:hypothetical protein
MLQYSAVRKGIGNAIWTYRVLCPIEKTSFEASEASERNRNSAKLELLVTCHTCTGMFQVKVQNSAQLLIALIILSTCQQMKLKLDKDC